MGKVGGQFLLVVGGVLGNGEFVFLRGGFQQNRLEWKAHSSR
jgi:hypothetical protein